jgi:hypothetical protein
MNVFLSFVGRKFDAEKLRLDNNHNDDIQDGFVFPEYPESRTSSAHRD